MAGCPSSLCARVRSFLENLISVCPSSLCARGCSFLENLTHTGTHGWLPLISVCARA